MSYFLQINRYEVLMEFNAPIAKSPHGHAVALNVGDIIINVEEDVYVEIDETYREQREKSNDTHVKALFSKIFVDNNPKIFKRL